MLETRPEPPFPRMSSWQRGQVGSFWWHLKPGFTSCNPPGKKDTIFLSTSILFHPTRNLSSCFIYVHPQNQLAACQCHLFVIFLSNISMRSNKFPLANRSFRTRQMAPHALAAFFSTESTPFIRRSWPSLEVGRFWSPENQRTQRIWCTKKIST